MITFKEMFDYDDALKRVVQKTKNLVISLLWIARQDRKARSSRGQLLQN